MGKSVNQPDLPINLKNPSIKYAQLIYALSGKIIDVSHKPQASSSAWTVQLDSSDEKQTFIVPWSVISSYIPSIERPSKPEVKSIQSGTNVDLYVNHDLRKGEKTVTQVVIK